MIHFERVIFEFNIVAIFWGSSGLLKIFEHIQANLKSCNYREMLIHL